MLWTQSQQGLAASIGVVGPRDRYGPCDDGQNVFGRAARVVVDVVRWFTGHHCHGALIGAKTAFNVQRLPRVGLFVFSHAVGVLGGRALGGHIPHARMGTADVQLRQSDRASNGRVGLPAGPVSTRAAVQPNIVANWPVDDDQRRTGVGGGLDGVEVEHLIAHGLHCGNHHRQVFRLAASHHGVHRQLLHGCRAPVGRNLADDVLRTEGSGSQHGSDPLRRGRYYR